MHGCSTELHSLLTQTNPTRVILLGDIFRKGPDPKGVWKLIKEWKIEAVLGNHDALLLKQYKNNKLPKKYKKKSVQWLKTLPLRLEEDHWMAVHAGINPYNIQKEKKKISLFVRRWPNDKLKEDKTSNPFWWELYNGSKLVIYGHDARRGVVDRRPHSLGLDSGCVYGNGLTGYILEEDRLITIPSQPYIQVHN